MLSPDEATALLDQRLHALDEDIAARRAMLEQTGKHLARLFLIEAEYALAMRRAEAQWVRGLLAELAHGMVPGLAARRDYHQTGRIAPGRRRTVDPDACGRGCVDRLTAQQTPVGAGTPPPGSDLAADPAGTEPWRTRRQPQR